MRSWGTIGVSCSVVILVIISILTLQSIYPQGVFLQAVYACIGLFLFFSLEKISYSTVRQFVFPAAWIIVVALILTFLLGKTTHGSTRWIDLGITRVQPSQFAIPVYALYCAELFSYLHATIPSAKKKQKKLLISAVPAVAIPFFIFIQPDLGTTTSFLVIAGAVLFFSGISKKLMLLGAVGIIIIALVAWNGVLHDYQRNRILSFVSPENADQTTGYNAAQAKIAVGSGKIIGRGFGHGIQSSLRFLPERQTDFFFASYAEETGFVGCVIVILVYAVLFVSLCFLILGVQDLTAFLFATSFTIALFWQASVNIGMNIGLVPITGVPLPLLSLGGSSLISFLFGLGIIRQIVLAQRSPHLFIEFRSFV